MKDSRPQHEHAEWATNAPPRHHVLFGVLAVLQFGIGKMHMIGWFAPSTCALVSLAVVVCTESTKRCYMARHALVRALSFSLSLEVPIGFLKLCSYADSLSWQILK